MNILLRILIDVVVVFVAFWLISLLPLPYPIPMLLKVIVVLGALYDLYRVYTGTPRTTVI